MKYYQAVSESAVYRALEERLKRTESPSQDFVSVGIHPADWVCFPRHIYRARVRVWYFKGFVIGFTTMSIVASLIWYLK